MSNAHSVSPASVLPFFTKTTLVILWVFGLWAWGAALNNISNTGNLGIVAISLVPATILFWKHPAYGIIAIMFFASGFLPSDFVDVRLSIGGGLEIRDLLVLLMFGLMLFRQLVNQTLPLPLFPAGMLLVLFFILMIMALFHALFIENVASNWALSEARILSFYLVFFIVAWGITHKDALYTLVAGSFVIAEITAFIILIQQILGPHHHLVAGMQERSWGVWESTSGARVVPPGIVYLYFINLISIALLFLGNNTRLQRLFLIINSLILSIALVFTYTRSAWVASAISILIMLPFIVIIYRQHIIGLAGLLGVITSLFILNSLVWDHGDLATDNPTLLAITNRLYSIVALDNTLEENSLQWRLFEYQEAMEAIAKQPLTGVGLGNSYRPITVFQGEAQGLWTDNDISYLRIDRFTRYVHSSYLAIPLKMGIPALIVLLSFYVSAITASFARFATLPNAHVRAIVLAIGTGLIGLLQWSIMHAHLMLASSTAVIGLIVGLLACMDTIYPEYLENARPTSMATEGAVTNAV